MPASATAPRCGLSGRYATNSFGYGSYKFSIRNCHGSAVHRKLDIANAKDSKCYYIPANRTIYSSVSIRPGIYVRKMKPC